MTHPILSDASLAHYCAGKMEGVIVALNEAAPGNVFGTHAVSIMRGDKLTQLPITSEVAARAQYWDAVRKFNAASI